MSWWQWVLLWLLLAVLGAAYVGWRLWRLWGPLKKLGAEAAIAQERLAAIEAEINELEHQLRTVDDLAVLQDPAELRRQRADLKARHRAQRAAHRKSHRPDWAHHVEW
ncbi:hypothetical protein GCM10011492_28300 [Flexivirga endophytica]|uniref:Uncharacterized protein n=1 Tax=Flexivirga endophytica TaxID=1849103 RepID=A0A916T8S6_9MICO|nr:hypothetical protein [Flexivirga endophytica]GGB35937.1 hypothetical protein GCM10011492_28300 [Flexivirga endophytica]GHB43711.1 hypothetical protein GCM10008112_10680 [Flexivirga endophytica]